MGKTLVGKVIYFWIFIIGGMMVGYFFHLFPNNKDLIIFLFVLAGIYWLQTWVRMLGRKRRGEDPNTGEKIETRNMKAGSGGGSGVNKNKNRKRKRKR